MLFLIVAVLVLALFAAIWALWRQHTAIRRLYEAIARKQPLLRDEEPGATSTTWELLYSAASDLITEVTRLQQLRSGQLAQLEATLGSLREAVLIVDTENNIVLSNKALQSIFPQAGNSLNQRLELVLHSADFLQYVDAVRKGKALPQQEIEFIDGGQSIWTEATGTPIPALERGREPWALFVLHDITKQKKLESVRKDLVANVSHELRTPLSVIKGYVETLVDGHHDMPLEDRTRFLATIQRHTERLNSLLEDILALSRLESVNPGLRRESTALTALLVAVVDDYRGRPAAADHHLEVHADPALGTLMIDPVKITQAVENLLDNAIKYTPKGSHIVVSAARRDIDAVITVSDDGPGIPEADLPHIFERFYRVEKGRSREKGGTGLGLSIVKHIVQLHGGQITVESRAGQGTAFSFTLPLRSDHGPDGNVSSPIPTPSDAL